MEIIDDMLEDLTLVKEFSSEKEQHYKEIFSNTIDKVQINQDVYYSAKAFTSIVNNIIRKKFDYINYIAKNQIELLTFLNTYDDKYLSNIENLLIEEAGNEILIIDDLLEDISNLLGFLQDLLETLQNLNQNKQKFNLHSELNKMLDDLENKYKGGAI